MKYLLLIFLSFFIFCSTHAFDGYEWLALNHKPLIQRALPDLKDIDWEVGDFQERQIKKGSIRVGRLKSWVDREENDESFWLLSDLKIIFKKKQEIEILIERKTGTILKYIVDGEEQDPPDITKLDECEELSEAQETVKVPAGEYKSLRSVLRCEEEVIVNWTSEDKVNMGGHVRQALLKEGEEDPKKIDFLVELTKFGKM